MADNGTDDLVLSLFEEAGAVETPTPGVRAWLGRDATNGRKPVLIKRIEAAGASKGRATEALALLHPGIVRTRRWLASGDALYVVRDVVRGKNLRQTLAPSQAGGTAFSAETVKKLLLPLLGALEHAHGEGVAHGGVSPENVLVGDDGQVYLSDWATVDPKAPQHFLHYSGTASVGGDVRALGKLVTTFLPTTGSFAHPAVRGRIENIVERCDTLADLKETVSALERLAAAPLPRGEAVTPPPPRRPGPPAIPNPADPTTGEWAEKISGDGTPRLTCTLAEKTARVAPGGGGTTTLIVKNEGSASLVVRMIATQHAWLNVRPLELPLSIPPGGSERVPFAISAARLTPGEYRSEVYLSANAGGKTAEDLRGGWFKHTAEIRVTVEGGGAFSPGGAAPAPVKPPYPTNAPRVPSGSGCALVPLTALAAFACCLALLR